MSTHKGQDYIGFWFISQKFPSYIGGTNFAFEHFEPDAILNCNSAIEDENDQVKMLLLSMLIALVSMSASAQTQEKNQKTVQIKNSSVCGMCKKTLASERGVKASSLNVDAKVLTVLLDSRRTSLDKVGKTMTEKWLRR